NLVPRLAAATLNPAKTAGTTFSIVTSQACRYLMSSYGLLATVDTGATSVADDARHPHTSQTLKSKLNEFNCSQRSSQRKANCSAAPLSIDSTLSCRTTTPFGGPVEPEV